MLTTDCMDTITGSPQRQALPSWTTWLGIGVRKLSRDALTLIDALAEHGERRRQRCALLSLDERMLKDIGLSQADVWLEARKSLWQR